MKLHSTPAELFFTKNDPFDIRLGEWIKPILKSDEVKDRTLLLGYPDDEGIRLNGGRPGAASGPDSIRRILYRMTRPHNFRADSQLHPLDLGNLTMAGQDLESRHRNGREIVSQSLEMGARRILSLGGGHDYGYCDGAGLIDWCQRRQLRPLIINFDAHLDVRPTDRGLNSGTPFFRLLTEFKEPELIEIGIQEQCNSSNHWRWAEEQGARILPWSEIEKKNQNPAETILGFLQPHLTQKRPTFLSVDIDGFESSSAPGCSQSWPLGFQPRDWFRVFDHILQRLDVRVLGIYEVSPPLDPDSRTAKLAALIAHRFLFHSSGV